MKVFVKVDRLKHAGVYQTCTINVTYLLLLTLWEYENDLQLHHFVCCFILFFSSEKVKDVFLIIEHLKNHCITLQTCAISFPVKPFTEISRRFCLTSVAYYGYSVGFFYIVIEWNKGVVYSSADCRLTLPPSVTTNKDIVDRKLLFRFLEKNILKRKALLNSL